jgi:hypothetical protein
MFSMQLKFLLLTILFSATVFGQVTKQTQTDDEFIKSVIATLEPNNMLKFALENGDRGTGVHVPLMDEMKKLGIKQVSIVMELAWTNNNLESAQFKRIRYLMKYYNYGAFITDESVLDTIRWSGLEQKVKDEACRRAKTFLRDEKRNMMGTFYVDLVDDERLPRLTTMPELEVVKSTR